MIAFLNGSINLSANKGGVCCKSISALFSLSYEIKLGLYTIALQHAEELTVYNFREILYSTQTVITAILEHSGLLLTCPHTQCKMKRDFRALSTTTATVPSQAVARNLYLKVMLGKAKINILFEAKQFFLQKALCLYVMWMCVMETQPAPLRVTWY